MYVYLESLNLFDPVQNSKYCGCVQDARAAASKARRRQRRAGEVARRLDAEHRALEARRVRVKPLLPVSWCGVEKAGQRQNEAEEVQVRGAVRARPS